MNYNNYYEHIYNCNIIFFLIFLSFIPSCCCTKHSLGYKLYKDNRMVTINNITSVLCNLFACTMLNVDVLSHTLLYVLVCEVTSPC